MSCEIQCWTQRRSHSKPSMGFQLAPWPLTLDDLELPSSKSSKLHVTYLKNDDIYRQHWPESEFAWKLSCYFLFLFLCLRHRSKTVPEAFVIGSVRLCEWVSEWVRECVSLCVPKTLWTPYLKNQWREFHPDLVTGVLGFVFVLIRFWYQGLWQTDQVKRSNIKVTAWIQYLRKYLS